MKQLLLLRHGRAVPHEDGYDWDRELRRSGVDDATAAGRLLAAYQIDLAVVSNAVRAAQTWQLACNAGASATRTNLVDWLYGVSGTELTRHVAQLSDALHTVIFVGHEPGLSHAITHLAAPEEETWPASEGLPTSSFVVLSHQGRWSTMAGQAKFERYEYVRA